MKARAFGDDLNPKDEHTLSELAEKISTAMKPFGDIARSLRKRGENHRAHQLVATLLVATAQGLDEIESIEITFKNGLGMTVSTVTGGQG